MKPSPVIARVLRFFALSFLFLPAATCIASPQGNRVSPKSIRVVMDNNYPPYVFKDDRGQLKGITIDQWALWEKRTGIRVEITGTDWNEAQRRMEAGEFDVIDTIFRNAKREKIYDFTKPYAIIPVPLFFHKDISGISGPDDARGFMVAAKAGGNVLDVLRKHGVTDIAEYPSYEKIIEAARDGKVKVFTVDRPPALYYLNKMGIQDRFRETAPLYNGEFHRAVPKGRSDLLATVEKGFADITPAEYRAIDKKWLGTPLSVSPYFRYVGYSALAIAALVAGLLVWLRLLKRAVSLKTQELSESEEQLRAFMDNASAVIFMKDIHGRYLHVNPLYEELFNATSTTIKGKTDFDIFPHDQAAQLVKNDRMVMESGRPLKIEEVVEQDDGPHTYLSAKFPLKRVSGEIYAVCGISTDITELKRAHGKINRSEERFRAIMSLSPDIISIVRKDGVFLYKSPSAEQIHGYAQDEMLGRPVFDLIHPEDRENVERVFSELLKNPEKIASVQYRHSNKDGSYIWMESYACNQLANPHIDGIIVISRNIEDRKKVESERLKLEQQLLHAQKLESLGVLAGGIAHDFNNILMTIMGNADLALMRMAPESPAVDNLRRIENAAAQAADLAKQMLAYSGKGKFIVEHIDLNSLLKEMLHMLEVSISKSAVLRLNLAKDLPLVEADVTQMRQIIMNLVINASEAIGDTSGVIAITTGCMECDAGYLRDAWLDEDVAEGHYAYLEIADTGCGMNKETLAKIFDPFFTTKFTGRGLGMAAVLGILRGHKGAIKVYSEPGKGTTFKILLPVSNQPAKGFSRDSRRDDWHGEGKVLLVDDDETICSIGAEMLEELGFSTATAKDGREAVALFKETPGIAFVILDLTMPHMNGEQCFRELRRIQPDVKVIMSSGYNEQEVTQKFVGKGLAGFIQKPYRLSALREVIQKM
ncbi:PAS domain S-box protein [Geobacter sp. AOG2]|uniref:PAS domain S-box protein n=1 Tax=Geobacter sp. AOG2 TaxID=1566347 RepID=UPI001CC82831|nr:transporter substrate-binding domain-containing protein [Geobacter sp. AOG2]